MTTAAEEGLTCRRPCHIRGGGQGRSGPPDFTSTNPGRTGPDTRPVSVVTLPVLLAITAHLVGAQFRWRRGLSERAGCAQGFYALLIASIGLSGPGPASRRVMNWRASGRR
jgi:hypothetical protein